MTDKANKSIIDYNNPELGPWEMSRLLSGRKKSPNLDYMKIAEPWRGGLQIMLSANGSNKNEEFSEWAATLNQQSDEIHHLVYRQDPNGAMPGSEDEEGIASRFEIFTAADALKPLPPIDWVIKDLIPAGSLTVVYGDAGSKKTYAMIDAAMCIATGDPWLAYETIQGPILYIDEEMGYRNFTGRVYETLNAHDGNEETPFHYITLSGFDLIESKDVIQAERMIQKLGIRFVVVDALMDVVPDADENSVRDMQPALRMLRMLADNTNAAFVVIHHANKKGGYRGTTAIKGAVDLLLEISSEQKSNLINFKTEKPRLIENTEFAGNAIWGNDSFRIDPTEYIVGRKYLSSAEEYVLEYLAKNGKSKIKTIADAADTTSSNAARQGVYSITKKELAYRVNSGGKGVAAKYDLTHKGRKKAIAMGFIDEIDDLVKDLEK